MVEEEGKYYPMMKVRPPSDIGKTGKKKERFEQEWSEVELRYGKLLLKEKTSGSQKISPKRDTDSSADYWRGWKKHPQNRRIAGEKNWSMN